MRTNRILWFTPYKTICLLVFVLLITSGQCLAKEKGRSNADWIASASQVEFSFNENSKASNSKRQAFKGCRLTSTKMEAPRQKASPCKLRKQKTMYADSGKIVKDLAVLR